MNQGTYGCSIDEGRAPCVIVGGPSSRVALGPDHGEEPKARESRKPMGKVSRDPERNIERHERHCIQEMCMILIDMIQNGF